LILKQKLLKQKLLKNLNIQNDIYSLGITITKHETEKNDKTLTTIYGPIFTIPDIYNQIKEMSLISLK